LLGFVQVTDLGDDPDRRPDQSGANQH